MVNELVEYLYELGSTGCDDAVTANLQWFEPFLMEQGVQPCTQGDYVATNVNNILTNYKEEFEQWVTSILQVMESL